jgi:hypothetical protein
MYCRLLRKTKKLGSSVQNEEVRKFSTDQQNIFRQELSLKREFMKKLPQIQCRESLLSLDAESFVFQFALEKQKN